MDSNTSIVAILPYVVLGVFGAAFVGRFAKTRLWLYTFFILALLTALYFDYTWINVMYIVFAVGILFAEQFYPRDATEVHAETVHSVAYAILKRVAAPLALLALIYSGIGSYRPPWGLTALGVPFWAQAVIALLVLDCMQYWIHRAQHAFPLWWKFHRIHHLAEHMSAVAHGRTHLLEFTFVQVFSKFLVVTFLGLDGAAVAVGFLGPEMIIATLWAHANIDFPSRRLPWFIRIIANPNGHALHHTKADDRCNYSEIFFVWDILFGTYKCPVEARDQIRDFGVAGEIPSRSIVKEQLFLD